MGEGGGEGELSALVISNCFEIRLPARSPSLRDETRNFVLRI